MEDPTHRVELMYLSMQIIATSLLGHAIRPWMVLSSGPSSGTLILPPSHSNSNYTCFTSMIFLCIDPADYQQRSDIQTFQIPLTLSPIESARIYSTPLLMQALPHYWHDTVCPFFAGGLSASYLTSNCRVHAGVQ